MRSAITVALGILISTAPVLAQEALVGKYTGTFMAKVGSKGDVSTPVTVEITSAENGKLKGKAVRGATIGRGACAGNYDLEGSYAGSKIELRGVGGPSADCNMVLRLVAEGGKLKGTIGQNDIELSK